MCLGLTGGKDPDIPAYLCADTEPSGPRTGYKEGFLTLPIRLSRQRVVFCSRYRDWTTLLQKVWLQQSARQLVGVVVMNPSAGPLLRGPSCRRCPPSVAATATRAFDGAIAVTGVAIATAPGSVHQQAVTPLPSPDHVTSPTSTRLPSSHMLGTAASAWYQ